MDLLWELLRVALAGGAVLVSGWLAAVVLSRLAGKAEAVPRPNALQGWDLLVALGLFFGTLMWLQPAGGDGADDPAAALRPAMLVALAAAEALALFYFALRSGLGGMSGQIEASAPLPSRGPRWAAHAYLAVVPLLLALTLLESQLAAVFHLVFEPTRLVAGLQALPLGERLLALVFAVGLLPVFEEAVFRGYLWHAMAGRPDFGPRRALLYTTLLFTSMHPPASWPVMFVLGALLGWVRWRGGRLRLAIAIHVGHNALVALFTALS